MSTIRITLPDGSSREVPRGATPAEIARQISHGLAKEALVARATFSEVSPAGSGSAGASAAVSELIDLSRPLDRDAKLEILTDKNPESLEVFRHSAAHLLAAEGMHS